jgi:hypothetical protein
LFLSTLLGWDLQRECPINLNDFTDEENENARLRIIVDALILPTSDIPAVAKTLALEGHGSP